MKLSQFLEVRQYNWTKMFRLDALDMQIADLRTVLQLPYGELEGGCNLATTTLILNAIAGVSVCLYIRNGKIGLERERERDRGPRFKELLLKYYPWEGEQVQREEATKVLWESVRNPLAHSLGLGFHQNTLIEKSPLSVRQIAELEDSLTRPTWLPRDGHTLEKIGGTIRTGFVLSVPALYWGFHRLLHKLLFDENQMKLVEGWFIARLGEFPA